MTTSSASALIVDASITVRLFTPNANRQLLLEMVGGWHRAGIAIYAPSLYVYETTSAICKLRHFGQLSSTQADEALRLADQFGVEIINVDSRLVRQAYDWTVRLKRAAAYDSFYLAAAETLGCELWTADRRLVNAANQPWVKYALVADGETGNAASV